MTTIFKIGNHIAGGISLTKIPSMNKFMYSFMITFMLMHLQIVVRKWGVRIGISSGDSELYFRVNLGLTWNG